MYIKTETTWGYEKEEGIKEKENKEREKERKVAISKGKEKYHYLLVIWWNNTILERKGTAIKNEKLREMTNRVPSQISIIIEPLTLIKNMMSQSNGVYTTWTSKFLHREKS